MTTRCLRIIGVALAPWVASALLQAEPIGRPTPPACAVEGQCHPATGTWGYTKTKWRPWPGTGAGQDSAGEASAIGSDIVRPTSPPDARTEDKVAPPKVEALEPLPEQSPATDDGMELPPREEINLGGGEEPAAGVARPQPPQFNFPGEGAPDLPFGPNEGAAPAPGQPPAAVPTESPNMTPNLPFGGPSGDGGFFPSGMNTLPQQGTPAVVQSDLPPAFPLSMQNYAATPQESAGQTMQYVMPAAAALPTTSGQAKRASMIPTSAGQANRVQQIGYQRTAEKKLGDTPPHLPAGLFGGR